MKKILFLITVVSILSLLFVLSGCDEGEIADTSADTTDIGEEAFDFAPTVFFFSDALLGSDTDGETEKLSLDMFLEEMSENGDMAGYFNLKTFAQYTHDKEKKQKIIVAGEKKSVEYVRSEKIVSDEVQGIYDSYDIYIDDEITTYHIRSDGEVVYMHKGIPSLEEVNIPEEEARKIADEYIVKLLDDRSNKYEFHSAQNHTGFCLVIYQLKMDGVDNLDRVLVFINSDHEVYSFSAQNLGRFDDVADSFTSTVENKYITHLKEKLAGLGIEGYELADSYLCEYAQQLYLCVEMKQGNVTVDGAEKRVDQTYFYISVDTAEN